MPRFLYRARDGQGALATGVVAAVSLEAAGQSLRAEGKYIVHLRQVHEEPQDPAVAALATDSRHIRRQDVVFFTHQIATMVETGVPIGEALHCVQEQTANPHFRSVLGAIVDHVEAGGDLSTALKRFPRTFPPIMTSLVHASEVSGTMGTMLDRVSSYLEKEEGTRRQVRHALAYPLVMIVMAISVTVFLLTFVLPRFAKIYAARRAVLPGPTRVLLAISNSLVEQWFLWVAGAVLAAVVLWLFTGSGWGRRVIDYLKLHVPVLRGLFTQLYLSRACRAMGTMMNAGVPLIDTIQIVRQVTVNAYYDDLWNQVDAAIKQGLQLSDPLSHSQLLPRSVVQMIKSGEKSGRLAQVLNRVAEHTEQEFDQAVKTATQFLEPLMVMVMGSLVGFVAIALLLPIFNISRVVAS